jgi:hypothetical protein
LLQVITGLQSTTLSREEVVTWRKAVVSQFGPRVSLSVEDGYWYFQSLKLLEIQVPGSAGFSHFIREQDLEEYHFDISRVPCDEAYGGIRRLRSFEVGMNAIRWPLTTFRVNENTELSDRGLTSTRGTFEERGDMVEHIHLWYDNAIFLIVKQFDEFVDQAMILGTDRDPDRLAGFMAELELEPDWS